MIRGFRRAVGERFLAPDGDDRRTRSGVSEEEEFLRRGSECRAVVKGSPVKRRGDTCGWTDHRHR